MVRRDKDGREVVPLHPEREVINIGGKEFDITGISDAERKALESKMKAATDDLAKNIKRMRRMAVHCSRCGVVLKVKPKGEGGNPTFAYAFNFPTKAAVLHDYQPAYDERPPLVKDCKVPLLPSGLLNMTPPRHPDDLKVLGVEAEPEWVERELRYHELVKTHPYACERRDASDLDRHKEKPVRTKCVSCGMFYDCCSVCDKQPDGTVKCRFCVEAAAEGDDAET